MTDNGISSIAAWQKLGEPGRPIYRILPEPKVMAGVKRIDVTFAESGTIVITVETEEGTMAANLNMWTGESTMILISNIPESADIGYIVDCVKRLASDEVVIQQIPDVR